MQVVFFFVTASIPPFFSAGNTHFSSFQKIAPTLHILGNVKKIEKLRVKNTHNKVKSVVGVADNDKQGGLTVAYKSRLYLPLLRNMRA